MVQSFFFETGSPHFHYAATEIQTFRQELKGEGGRGKETEGCGRRGGIGSGGEGRGKGEGERSRWECGRGGCGSIQKVGVGGEIDLEFRNSRLTVDSAFRISNRHIY